MNLLPAFLPPHSRPPICHPILPIRHSCAGRNPASLLFASAFIRFICLICCECFPLSPPFPLPLFVIPGSTDCPRMDKMPRNLSFRRSPESACIYETIAYNIRYNACIVRFHILRQAARPGIQLLPLPLLLLYSVPSALICFICSICCECFSASAFPVRLQLASASRFCYCRFQLLSAFQISNQISPEQPFPSPASQNIRKSSKWKITGNLRPVHLNLE